MLEYCDIVYVVVCVIASCLVCPFRCAKFSIKVGENHTDGEKDTA